MADPGKQSKQEAVASIQFVADANFFLHCLIPEQLDWKLVTDVDDIEILASLAIIKEIDDFKSDPFKKSRAKRARMVGAWFARAIDDKQNQCCLKSMNPRVTLRLLAKQSESPNPDKLPLNSADNKLVADAHFLCKQSAGVAFLLSNDTGVLLKCKQHGIPFKRSPDEWLLPPKPDSRDKEIKSLQGQVKALQSQSPEISLTLKAVGDASDFDTLNACEIPDVENLVNRASQEIRSQYPPQSRDEIIRNNEEGGYQKMLGLSTYWKPPSEAAIRKYLEVDYPKFMSELGNAIRTHIVHYEHLSRAKILDLKIDNLGSVQAEQILLNIAVFGDDWELFDPQSKSEKASLNTAWPKMPEPPQGRYFSALDSMASSITPIFEPSQLDHASLLSHLPKNRDKHSWYWKEEPVSGDTRWALERQILRHLRDSEEFLIGVRLGLRSKSDGKLRIDFSASNLPIQKQMIQEVRFSKEPVDSGELIASIMQEFKYSIVKGQA
jgi:PIN domain-containing protein